MSLSHIIKRPMISEKAVFAQEHHTYVFVVDDAATKAEIKKAIKAIYKVDPVSVNIVRRPAKSKRFRGVMSSRAGYKKAMVTIKAGQKIDLAV